MPCEDTTSRISVRLDTEGRLAGFQYAKITCGKEIGGNTGFAGYCKGMEPEKILELKFDRVREELRPKEEFFFYLEWDALHSALAQYLGRESDSERHRIATIISDENGVEIRQAILPPKEMPGVVSCAERARSSAR